MWKLFAAGALAGISLIAAPQTADAGCHINLKVVNKAASEVVSLNTWNSQVRTKNGTWRRLIKGGWTPDTRLDPGERTSDVYRAALKCGKRRQFRIHYVCKAPGTPAEHKVKYFPHAKGFTPGQSFLVGLSC